MTEVEYNKLYYTIPWNIIQASQNYNYANFLREIVKQKLYNTKLNICNNSK